MQKSNKELEQIELFKEDDMTEIRQCSCVHEVQDEFYGKQNRVHNECAQGWRCTVCSAVKIVSKEE